ncbi:hypothetical protein Pmar_PMAR006451 [Perkinsus marinus ATCC 50983]|uniref:Uncharacterized protein n=1 Tax=Perkinsus marinus (strain ATCC 50983 / TXsc) TaxID=423536 RepID=C5K9Q5_PERM5|nr:hypothetical protein Pmar_PMAR006451 [Perkinsus marinus ATCC 50983]EER18827.1 hypothetical protein Pmar_PMAR006451 [Perkinsus marinus ATCC 50983]|eukprot:XP_002787031.1 hypothetical protein Pmar_PMAR006451 [Perkinsus marinus ATCC 50983]
MFHAALLPLLGATVVTVQAEVTHSLARLLDETLFLGVTDTAVTLEGGQQLSTVSEIVSVDGGRHHLDHWNVYSVPEDATASRGVQVEMHADMGLFLLLSLPPGDRSLQFEEGVVSIPDDGDALVVIFGEALKSWMASTVDIMAARHRVAIPASNGSQPRVVFGRMMMAPPTALNSAGVSYQQFFMAPQAFQSRRMLSQCAAGQVYCWLRCMTPPEGCPAENAVCWDFRKMDLCDMTPGKMQPDCALRCPAGIATAGEFAEDEPFCEGSTDMVMSGLHNSQVILGVAVGRILPTSDEPTGYRIDEADPCCAAISSNDMDPPLMVEPGSSYVMGQYTPVGASAAGSNMSSVNNVSQQQQHHHTANHLSPRPSQFVQQQQQLPQYTNAAGSAPSHHQAPSQNTNNSMGQPPRVQVAKQRATSTNMSNLERSVAHGVHPQQQAAYRVESPGRVQQHTGPTQAEVDKIHTELVALGKELQATTDKLREKEEEGRKLSAELDNYKVSEGHFKAALSKLRTENESLVSAAAASRAPDPKIADLTKHDLEETMGTLRETKQQLASLKAHLEQQSQLVAQEQTMLVSETEAQRGHIAKLEQALQEAAQENEMLQVELNSSTTDRSELKRIHEQLRNTEKERDAAVTARDAVVDRESALRLDLEAARKEARQALHRAELAEVKAEGRVYKEDVIKTSNLSHLKQNTDGSSSDGGESSAAAMVRKNRELEGLQEQLEMARDEIAHMQEERAELKRARREAEEKLQNINITVTEATSKNKIVSKLHAEVSDLKREIARLQEELARCKEMPRKKENRSTDFNVGSSVKSKYLSVAGPADTNATLNDLEVGRYSKISGSPFAESPMPHKTQRAFPSESTLIKSPLSAKKLGGRDSSGGRKSKESPVKIVRARGLLNNLTESDPIVSKALVDHRETDGLSKEECYGLIEKLLINHEIPVRVKKVTCTQVFRTIVDAVSQPPPTNLPSSLVLDYCKKVLEKVIHSSQYA